MATPHYLAFTGGIGGARLALGLARQLHEDAISFVVNTGDDFEHLGLNICPDIDTLVYTLANEHNPETGWGRKDESWNVMKTVEELGGDTWFRLGDRDLAMNLMRTQRLASGDSLSSVTVELARCLGVCHTILPPSNDPVRTVVVTADGEMAFQDYFVRDHCRPVVQRFRYEGADTARITSTLRERFNDPHLAGIIFCPSNPYLSLDPIFAVDGVRDAIQRAQVPVIAVSPIIGGDSVKGPLAKIMRELSVPVSATSVAAHYGNLLDGFVLDHRDGSLEGEIQALGIKTHTTETLMSDESRSRNLADECVDFIEELSGSGQQSRVVKDG